MPYVQERKRGQSVLHDAVNCYDMDIVNAVLSSRSLDVNLKTYDGLTALDMAISRRWNEGERVLVLAGGRTSHIDSVHSDSTSNESDMDWSVAFMRL